MKIRPVAAELFHADRQTDRQTDKCIMWVEAQSPLKLEQVVQMVTNGLLGLICYRVSDSRNNTNTPTY
jgi:hypothetical protein